MGLCWDGAFVPYCTHHAGWAALSSMESPCSAGRVSTGQRRQYFRKMLVELGLWVQASPRHTGSWVCYCLGWQKAQETVRGWQTFVSALIVGMFVHTHDGLADGEGEQGCGQSGRCQGTFASRTQCTRFFSFYLEVQVHELVLCSRPRPGQTPRVVNGSALYSPKDQRTQPLGPHTLALFIYFLFFSRISNLTEWF